MQKLQHRELHKELMDGGITKAIPEGIYKISFIYELVKDAYPHLCDDEYLCSECCKCGTNQPEWKHRVRTALGSLKGKGDVDKDGLEKGWWRVTINSTIIPTANELMILDATAGSRSMWHKNHKQNPCVLFLDQRLEVKGVSKGVTMPRKDPNGAPIPSQPGWKCAPDLLGDFTHLDMFEDETFDHIVWDPPHVIKKGTGFITMKYGYLGDKWKDTLKRGFTELWRILKTKSTLQFKWAENDIPKEDIVKLFFDVSGNPIDNITGTQTKKSLGPIRECENCGGEVRGTHFLIYFKFPEYR